MSENAVADYRVLKAGKAELTAEGDALSLDFRLPNDVLRVDRGQRPYLTFNISVAGPLPQTVVISLNGSAIVSYEYIDTNDGASQPVTRTQVFPGSLLSTGVNNLVFTLTQVGSFPAPDITISNVIVHFQREIECCPKAPPETLGPGGPIGEPNPG